MSGISNGEIVQLVTRIGPVVREMAGSSRTDRRRLWRLIIDNDKEILAAPAGREKEVVVELSERVSGVK